ncbi:MAG: alginate lyase family protein [Vicinamibacterales bacterium]
MRVPSPHEVVCRARQAVLSRAERSGLLRTPALDDWRRWLSREAPDDAGALLNTIRARPLVGHTSVEGLAQVVRTCQRAEDLTELLARADAIAEGRLDLLGHRRLAVGNPVDWHLEPVSGRRTPLKHWSQIPYLDPAVAGDKKITWELNRHQHLLTLGRAYALSGQERFAETFREHVAGWMQQNPPSRGINWASSLEVAFRAISWIWALEFFKHSRVFTPDFLLSYLWFLHAHGQHIQRFLSTYFSPNTHLTGEALGLLYLGRCLPELKGACRWEDLGQKILVREIDVQVRDDGTYFEQTTWYHRYTTDFYLHYVLLNRHLDSTSVRAVSRRAGLLLGPLMALTRPDGSFPLIGDDDGGRFLALDDAPLTDWRSTLSTAAILFARPDCKYLAGRLAEESLWLTGASGLEAWQALEAVQPAFCSIGFPNGGTFVSRTSWTPDADWLTIDAGPHGALSSAHGHADALSFELAVSGVPVIVDSGTFTYTGSADARDRFRSSRAHNALVVDDQSSSAPDGPFSWRSKAATSVRSWTTGHAMDYLDADVDGYQGVEPPVSHRRRFVVAKGEYVAILDSVDSPGDHRYEFPLHFPARCQVRPSTNRYDVVENDAAGPLVSIARLPLTARSRIVADEVSSLYGVKDSASALLTRLDGPGPRTLFTLLSFRSLVALPEAIPDCATAFTLKRANQIDYLGWGAWRSADGVQTDAEFTWIRTDELGQVLAAFLVNVLRFNVGAVVCSCDRRIPAIELTRSGGDDMFKELPPGISISGFRGALRQINGTS